MMIHSKLKPNGHTRSLTLNMLLLMILILSSYPLLAQSASDSRAEQPNDLPPTWLEESNPNTRINQTQYDFNGSLAAQGIFDSALGFQRLNTVFALDLSPTLRGQSGFLLTSQLALVTTPQGFTFAPGLTNLHYRIIFTRNPGTQWSDEVQEQTGDAILRTGSTLSSLRIGRVSRPDILGIFSPLVLDGLGFNLSTQALELDISVGYQGFLFNLPANSGYGENLAFLQSPSDPQDDLLPFASVWNQELPGVLELQPSPSFLVGDVRLVLPEIVGRQNLFLSAGYVQSVKPGEPLFSTTTVHGYGLTGSTGPLSTRTFYTLALGASYVSLPGLPDPGKAGLGLLGNVRTYLSGQTNLRLGFTGFASTSNFLLPSGLEITPGFIELLESATWFASVDLEGVLYRPSISPNLGLSWNGSLFGSGKTNSGPGLLRDPALLTHIGVYGLGASLGFRYRPLRDLLFTVDAGALAPINNDLGLPFFQVNLGVTLSY